MTQPLNLLVKLDNLRCIRSGEADTAEPYMWTIFFKVDGEKIFFDINTGRLQSEHWETQTDPDWEPILGPDGKPWKGGPRPPKNPPKKLVKGPPEPIVYATAGREGDIGRSARTAETLPIPGGIGEWRTTLQPINIRPAIQGIGPVPGTVGVVIVLLEEDNTPDSAMAAGKSTFDSQVTAGIRNLIKNITIARQTIPPEDIEKLQRDVQAAIRASIRSKINPFQWVVVGGDMDDFLGSGVFKFDGRDIALRKTTYFSQKWGWRPDAKGNGGSPDGEWEINGHISVL